MIKHLNELLNNSCACDNVMIDFKRAFDKVDHVILCEKLQVIGVEGCYLQWITDFLSDRKQYVKYNGSQSAEIEV